MSDLSMEEIRPLLSREMREKVDRVMLDHYDPSMDFAESVEMVTFFAGCLPAVAKAAVREAAKGGEK